MRVARVGFAAVKGTRHLTRGSIRVTTGGVEGDRAYAVADPSTGQVLRTVQHPALGRVEAEVAGDRLCLRMPDGTEVRGSTERTGPPVTGDYWGREAALHPLDGTLDGAVSAFLGRPAVVVAVDPGVAVWGASVSMLTTGTLARLEAGLRLEGIDVPRDLAERFRASVVLEAESDPSSGQRLRVGSAVVEVVGPIDRCAVIDADPVGGNRRPGILTALGPLGFVDAAGSPVFGVDARVREAGSVAPGDLVIHG
ncbi:hypothetical protein GCM10009867_19950 [Pedococcus aerophilus]|uniref:MOSC domain-containing protein n=1 Tax=Pedococcus aerophilus TaxID=436356 RepID=A0ABN3UND8_9MICO